MKTICLIFVFVVTISFAASDVFAQQLTVETNKDAFEPGEIVMVSGSIPEGASGDLVALEIKNSAGETILLRTVELDSDGKFDLTFKIPQSEESGNFEILATAEISGNKISETKSITQETQSQVSDVTQNDESGGGCLIATATYGSELAPQVQTLREIRDNSLLETQSGTNFMNFFNEFYYSFSPTIADLERENPVFREAVKITITPMIASLSILNHVDMNTESEVLGYGLSLIALNVGMYFVAPVFVISRIRK